MLYCCKLAWRFKGQRVKTSCWATPWEKCFYGYTQISKVKISQDFRAQSNQAIQYLLTHFTVTSDFIYGQRRLIRVSYFNRSKYSIEDGKEEHIRVSHFSRSKYIEDGKEELQPQIIAYRWHKVAEQTNHDRNNQHQNHRLRTVRSKKLGSQRRSLTQPVKHHKKSVNQLNHCNETRMMARGNDLRQRQPMSSSSKHR